MEPKKKITEEEIKKRIVKYYKRIEKLTYSKDNIAELYSIMLGLIKDLKDYEPDRTKNKCLHFILITKEKEFEWFDNADEKNWKKNFDTARTSLRLDLETKCLAVFNPPLDLD